LTQEQPKGAKALLSLKPLIPSREPFELRIEGLPNSGYLRISALLVGSDLISPDLTFNQAPNILSHIEQWVFLSFITAKIQLMSVVLGPLL